MAIKYLIFYKLSLAGDTRVARCVATVGGGEGGARGVRRRYVGESVVLGSTNGTTSTYSVLLLCLHRFAQARRYVTTYRCADYANDLELYTKY